MVPIADGKVQTEQTAWKEVCELSATWIASNKDKPDLVLLIEDRMAALRATWPAGCEKALLQSFAVTAADFYDELGWLPNEAVAECDQRDLSEMRSAITKTLLALGCALIHQPEWDSTVQRAISIERTAEVLAAPKILRFGRTGVTIAGELLRKQEVVLLSN